MSKKSHAFVPVILALAVAPAALAAGTPCAPCGGLSVADPYALIPALSAAPKIDPEARLYIAWDVDLDAAVTPAAGHALATAGATPWLRLVFRAAPPLFDHLDALQVELDTAAALAASLIPRAHFEVVWRPPGDPATAPSAQEYAFLIKRAAVALTGADPDAKVIAGPLPEDPAWLEEFYGQDVAAYVDALAFPPADEATERALVESATTLDPGKTLVLEGVALPDPRPRLLAEAARAQARGFGVTLFAAAGPLTAADVAPLALLADEFRGELSLDPGTRPTGAREAWSFVRGEDLALRVIVDNPDGSDSVSLSFPDPQLRDPERVLPDGEVVPLSGYRRTPSALQVEVADPGPAAILRVQRASIQELEGVAEEVTVNSRRQMPVEEILRRLQSFEDAQNRRVRHWRAVNSTTLRFQLASGVQTIEATFEGEIFYRPGEPFDWVWQNFYLNGVKWRGKSIPEIPLVQPEKAAAMPLEILFSKEYRYSLAGTDTVAGRDCWVVDFEPNAAVQAGTTLYRGRVWIDRATYARVRTRAVQLGLQGEVLSNEETLDYTPVDAEGRPTDWGAGAFVLPLHTTGQQVLSVVNTATVVEKDVRITGVVVNGPDFDEQHERALASEATMVRDTQGGLRYLVKEGAAPGGRVVQEGFDTSKLFALAGIFYDDSLSYPLPLAGVNYFNLDFHGNKRQLNAFFGGVLGIVNYADPRFLGSKVDLGADFFAIAIASSDQVFRDGNEVQAEEVKELPARARLNFGFPLGNFVKVSSSYELSYSHYSARRPHSGRLRPAREPLHPPPRTGRPVRPRRLPPEPRGRLALALEVGFLGPAGQHRVRRRDQDLHDLGGDRVEELLPHEVPQDRHRARRLRRQRPGPLLEVPVRLLRLQPGPRLPDRQGEGREGLRGAPDLRLRDRQPAAPRRGRRRGLGDRPQRRPGARAAGRRRTPGQFHGSLGDAGPGRRRHPGGRPRHRDRRLRRLPEAVQVSRKDEKPS